MAANEKQPEFKKALRFFVVTAVILFVLTVAIWAVQTCSGSVRIERLTLTGKDGTKLSSLIYIPENATSETPAPAVVVYHGTSNQAHSNDTWLMELAKRGYVVFSPDMSGGGQSDVTGDRTGQGIVIAQYATTLDIVDQEAGINLIGYSRGVKTIYSVYGAMPDQVNSLIAVFGNYRWQEADMDTIHTNVCMIKAKADQYDYTYVGDAHALQQMLAELFGLGEELTPGTDYDREGYLVRYRVIEDALHQTANISTEAIAEILEYINVVAPSPITMDAHDQSWQVQQLLSMAAAICFMFFVAAFSGLLVQLPLFQEVITPVTANHGLRGWKFLLKIAFEIVVGIVLFIPVSSAGMSWFAKSKIFESANLNGIMLWLMALSGISVLFTIWKIWKKKQAGEQIDLSDFAMGAEGVTKLQWNVIGKAFLIGAIVAFVCVEWIGIIEDFGGINYQFWCLATFVRLGPDRFVKAIPYACLIFIAIITSCMGCYTSRRLPDTGNARRDMIVSVAVNVVVSAAPLVILLAYQYVGSFVIGTGYAPLSATTSMSHAGTSLVFRTVGALDYAFGYCFMMGGTNGICTYLYRKTNNLWTGLMVGALFCGFMTTAAYTMVM
ncbi:MAG: hypothetical protein LIO81_11420 [Clostridiales bacterium]|nr:hypothetical protein [Clostridiales bacterium]